jgi:hypothetical protein
VHDWAGEDYTRLLRIGAVSRTVRNHMQAKPWRQLMRAKAKSDALRIRTGQVYPWVWAELPDYELPEEAKLELMRQAMEKVSYYD